MLIRNYLHSKSTTQCVCRLCITLLFAALLSGCGVINSGLQLVGLGKPPPPPPPELIPAEIPLSEQPMTVNIYIKAANDLNPDSTSRPSPARARIFVGDSTTDLMPLPIEEVFEFGDFSLDLKPVSSLTLSPGSVETVSLSSFKSNSKLTIAVAYRDAYNAQWIQSVDLAVNDVVNVNATLSSSAVTLQQN